MTKPKARIATVFRCVNRKQVKFVHHAVGSQPPDQTPLHMSDTSHSNALTQKVIRLMILRPPRRSRIRNLNTLQTVIHRALPTLQLEPSIRAVRKEQGVPRELSDSLRVEVFSGREVAVLESRVALLFESVGSGGHGASASGILAVGWMRCLLERCAIVVMLYDVCAAVEWCCLELKWSWFVSGLVGECGIGVAAF